MISSNIDTGKKTKEQSRIFIKTIDVLLIDDDQENIAKIKKMFSRGTDTDTDSSSAAIDYQMNCRTNYQQGLIAINEHDYDVCLLASQINNQDYTEFMNAITSRQKHTPVILLTKQNECKPDIHTNKDIDLNYLVKGQFCYNDLEKAIEQTSNNNVHKSKLISEEQLITILEATVDGLLAVNREGKAIFSNHKFAQMWNIPQEYIDSQDDIKLLNYVLAQLQNPEEFLATVKKLYKTPQKSKNIIKFKDGRVFERYSRPLLDKEKVTGRVWSFRDITERKRREEQITKLSQAVEQSPDCIVITDIEGNIEYANPRFEDLTGYSLKEAKGENPRVLQSGEHSQEFYQDLWQTISGGNIWYGEFHNKKKNGELYWESATIAPVMNTKGQIINYMAHKTDITKRKKDEELLRQAKEDAEFAEEELEHLNKQLEVSIERANLMTEQAMQAVVAKSEFLANISHEIRTPMNGIIGFGELLAQEELTEQQIEYVNTMLGCAKSLLYLINDILDYSKIEAGKMQIEMIDCELYKLLKETMQVMKSKSQEKGIELRIKYLNDIPALIVTDPVRLRQCLFNLTGNAIKFTEEGYVNVNVSHKTTSQGSLLYIAVEDSGIGIAPQAQETIFESFTQADSSTTRKYGGTGLGLAITKQLIECMGGCITLESTPEQGSTFTLMLPTKTRTDRTIPPGEINFNDSKRSKNSSIESAEKDKKRNTGKQQSHQMKCFKGKVLVAEDNKVNRRLIEILLKKMQVNLHLTKNGKEALQKLQQENYDLVLMDMQMPVMDGFAAVQTIRKMGFDVPVVALTAHTTEEKISKIQKAGCNDYLIKPLQQDKLLNVLEKYLTHLTSDNQQNTNTKLQIANKQMQTIPEQNLVTPEYTDREKIISSLANDPDMIPVIEIFLQDVEVIMEKLQDAINHNDMEKLTELAHELKGSSGSAGFGIVFNKALKLENMAKKQQINEIQQLFSEIKRNIIPQLNIK